MIGVVFRVVVFAISILGVEFKVVYVAVGDVVGVDVLFGDVVGCGDVVGVDDVLERLLFLQLA